MSDSSRSTLRVYFDTSVYLAPMMADQARADVAEVAIMGAIQGKTQAFISSLVVAEAVGAPNVRAPQGVPPAVGRRRADEIAAYMDSLGFTYVEGGRAVGARAGELAREYQLKGPDALHLALAERAQCDEFYSFDGGHLKIGSLGGMSIREPRGHADGMLELDEQGDGSSAD